MEAKKTYIVGVIILLAAIIAGLAVLITIKMGLWMPPLEQPPASGDTVGDLIGQEPAGAAPVVDLPPLDWDLVYWEGPDPLDDAITSNLTALLAATYNARQMYDEQLYLQEQDQDQDQLSVSIQLFAQSALHAFWGNPQYILEGYSQKPLYILPQKEYGILNEMSLFTQRRGSKLLGFYKRCSPVAVSLLSKTLYRKLEIDYLVNLLHDSYYAFCTAQGEFQQGVALSLYTQLSAKPDTTGQGLTVVQSWLAQEQLSLVILDSHSTQDAHWAYGFWARRAKEANHREVYYILRDIRDRYR